MHRGHTVADLQAAPNYSLKEICVCVAPGRQVEVYGGGIDRANTEAGGFGWYRGRDVWEKSEELRDPPDWMAYWSRTRVLNDVGDVIPYFVITI
jgi:hypothetical protein